MSVPVQGPGVLTLRLLIPGYSAPVFRLNGLVKSLGLPVANTAWQAIGIPLPAGPQVLEISAPPGGAGAG